MTIFTILRGSGVVATEHNSWTEVIKDGWIFIGMNKQQHVLMTRYGYINEFWED